MSQSQIYLITINSNLPYLVVLLNTDIYNIVISILNLYFNIKSHFFLSNNLKSNSKSVICGTSCFQNLS